MPPGVDAGWTGVNVAVTGATGFIGGHLVEALVRAGASVRALTSRPEVPGGSVLADPDIAGAVDVWRGDVRDPAALGPLVAGCAHVFHLAALVSVPYSVEHPREVADVNVTGTRNVARAVLGAEDGRLLQVSSAAGGRSPYAASKAAGDALVLGLHRAHGLPATIVRPANAYGPRQSLRAVLPTIVVQALAGGPVRLGALDPRRDLTYVADTVAGLLAAASSARTVGEALELGTGTEHSVADMVAAVGRAVGRELVVELDPARARPAAADAERRVADPARLRELTGWTPHWTFDEGVAALVAWAAARA